MRQIRETGHEGVEGRFGRGDLPVQFGDLVADGARLGLPGLGLDGFLLRHQHADILRHGVAPRTESLDFLQMVAPLLIVRQDLVELLLVVRAASREPFANPIRVVPDHFDVEHGREYRKRPRRGKVEGRSRGGGRTGRPQGRRRAGWPK